MTNNTPDYIDNLYFEKLQKSKNVANNVTNENSQDLTEKCKKGELPEGFYFVNDGAEVTIDYYLCDYWERHFDSDIQQVLAPVPSYKEWKEIVESEMTSHLQADSYYNKILDLKERNDSLNNRDINLCRIANGIRDENFVLKELLRECKIYVENFIEGSTLINEHHISYILLQRIKEVLK